MNRNNPPIQQALARCRGMAARAWLVGLLLAVAAAMADAQPAGVDGLSAIYPGARTEAMQARVALVRQGLGPRYVELLRDPGVFWNTREFVAFGRTMGTVRLDAMPLTEVLASFGRALGTTTIFRGVRIGETGLRQLLRNGFETEAFRFGEGAGNPLEPPARQTVRIAGPPKPAELIVADVTRGLQGAGRGDVFVPVSENVAIARSSGSHGAGEAYVVRLEVPRIVTVDVAKLAETYGLQSSPVGEAALGEAVEPLDPKAETRTVDLVARDAPAAEGGRSPFLDRLHRLRSLFASHPSLSPAALATVLRRGMLNALAPVTQFGRALREAGIYHRRPIIQAELAAAGVESSTLGGVKARPPADLLADVLEREGVSPEKRAEIVERYGGRPAFRELVLEHGGARINLNQPYRLAERLGKAGISQQVSRAVVLERSRGAFQDLADFESRIAKQELGPGESAKTLAQVKDGGPPRAPESIARRPFRERAVVRLKDFFAHRSGGRSILPNAAQRYLGSPVQTLMTIMVFHAVLQHRATGKVDVQQAVNQTLDSPQVWSGLASAGAASAAMGALRRSLAKGTGARAMFSRLLGGLPGSIAVFAAWEVGAAMTDEALRGVQVPGKASGEPVTVTDVFRHGSVAGQVLGNYAKLAVNPVLQAQVLGRVLKDRILTAEFFFTAAGMWAGGKVGAFAGVKVGAWLGAAFGPPGMGIGAAAGGIVGGITGGVIGGFGGAWAGSAVDTWMARRGFAKATEALEKAASDTGERRPLPDDELSDALDTLAEARDKLVEKLSTDFAGKAKRYLSERDLPREPGEVDSEEQERRRREITARQRQVEASRLAVLDVYEKEIELLGRLIQQKEARGEDASDLIERENDAVMAMTMFLVGADQALQEEGGAVREALDGGRGAGEEPASFLRPEEPPSFRELPSPAAVR